MMSQGDSWNMGTTGCLCVPAQPASFISQSPPARQQEDNSGAGFGEIISLEAITFLFFLQLIDHGVVSSEKA